jgi:hypothetical protein
MKLTKNSLIAFPQCDELYLLNRAAGRSVTAVLLVEARWSPGRSRDADVMVMITTANTG